MLAWFIIFFSSLEVNILCKQIIPCQHGLRRVKVQGDSTRHHGLSPHSCREVPREGTLPVVAEFGCDCEHSWLWCSQGSSHRWEISVNHHPTLGTATLEGGGAGNGVPPKGALHFCPL